MARMAARTAVVAGTATAVSGRIARRQARKYYGKKSRQSRSPPEGNLTAKLQQLVAPHSQEVLSDEEFSAAKAKVLGI